MFFSRQQPSLVSPQDALPGRAEALPDTPDLHFVSGNQIRPPFPEGVSMLVVGMGCFWGAERKFWQIDGVYSTAVGYAGGFTPNPTYREVCSGRTGHTEVVLVAFRPQDVSLGDLLRVFWEGHDPTQGMQQGNDVGTQYRSAIFTDGDAQAEVVAQSRATYQAELDRAGHPAITTEVAAAGPFFYAEAEHQQYLGKNPGGYCGLGGTGVACPIGLKPAG
ncbi:MAG: peptide-methionine (S)-S-oxide reductase MsrA [Nannocystaceae bacterium]|nr:peptide-methionine (S)-S-oxide reductase MsrA [Nannocystaceae bacterium]